MSQTYRGTQTPTPLEAAPSGWAVGWTVFAGVMMVVQGCWWFIAGLVAFFNDEFYVVGEEYSFQFDVTTWGWVHVFVGLVILAAGLALFTGATGHA